MCSMPPSPGLSRSPARWVDSSELALGVRTCASHPLVRAMDFVEVDAEADVNGLTLDAMAHIVLSAAAGLAERPDSDPT